MEFRQYLSDEEKKDIKSTLEKIPKIHSDLVKDYDISFQPSNTLKGDKGHIGFIDEENKKIIVSSPWNYGREYTLLHEIGHAVWKYVLDGEKKKSWREILNSERKKDNDNELSQNDEEMFCMLYAQNYANNKLVKHENKKLLDFVRSI